MNPPTNPSSSRSLPRSEVQAINAARSAISGAGARARVGAARQRPTEAETSSRQRRVIPVVDLTQDESDGSPASVSGRTTTDSQGSQRINGQTMFEFLANQPPTLEESIQNSGVRKRRLGSVGETGRNLPESDHYLGIPSSSAWSNYSRMQPWETQLGDVATSSDFSAAARQRNSLRHRERSYTDHTLPKWQPDSEVTNCPICGMAFSFWSRKHHCRKCGRVVCAACSPHRITIPQQFIVRPPEPRMASPTEPALDRPVGYTRIAGERCPMYSVPHPSSLPFERQTSNSGLGGGEVVRLCNPCVPDPNPEPPRRYSSLQLTPSVENPSPSVSGHPPCLGSSVPSSAIYHSLPARPHRLHSSLATPGRWDFDPTGSYGQFPSGPAGVRAQSSSYNFSDSRGVPSIGSPPVSQSSRPRVQIRYVPPPDPAIAASVSSFQRLDSASLSRPRRPQIIDENDLCPVCDHRLPPRAADGNEENREAHIRACINSRTGGSSSTSDQPSNARQMVHFTATEKDCIGDDGQPQECTICMEEYEVGAELTRLLCFCKYHKTCIVDWFQHKEECPVHKISE